MKVCCILPDGQMRKLTALIDTGAEVSLIRQDLVSPDRFTLSKTPINLIAANGMALGGGDREVMITLQFRAENPTSRQDEVVEMQGVRLYGASIEYELLLAYDWLASSGLLLYATANASLKLGRPLLWIKGKNAERSRFRRIQGLEPEDRRSLGDLCQIMAVEGLFTRADRRVVKALRTAGEREL